MNVNAQPKFIAKFLVELGVSVFMTIASVSIRQCDA